MCNKCDLLAAHLLFTEAERDTVLFEKKNRLAPSNAVRPLTDQERKAKVHFADVEDILEWAEKTIREFSEQLHNMIREAILLALLGKNAKNVSPYEAVAALEKLVQEQPATVQAVVVASVAGIAEVLSQTYSKASGEVIAEAARQGVKDLPKPSPGDKKRWETAAKAVAAHPWQRILSKVQTELTKPAVLLKDKISRKDVLDVLDTVKIDGTQDIARQTIHSAAGTGRLETAEELEPTEIWASEIMDGNACPACEKVDGKDYATLEDAREDYPFGFYEACHGGARCRGTLVFMYE